MSKKKRQIEKQDLLPPDVYTKNRKQIRKDLIEFKKDNINAENIVGYTKFLFVRKKMINDKITTINLIK